MAGLIAPRATGTGGGTGRPDCWPSAAGPDGQPSVLLILRAASWTQHAGTWGPPGGARDSHESAAGAALREAAEECAVPPDAVADPRPAATTTTAAGPTRP